MSTTTKQGLGNFAADAATNAQRRQANGPGSSDGTWKDIQLSTFTNWVNAQLSKGGHQQTEDVVEDFKEGVALIQMLEVLTDRKLGKYHKKPRMKFNRLENINTAFKFIEKEGLKLVNIDPNDIENGNTNLVLGLLWTIMYHYQILPNLSSTTGKSAKEMLLEWVQRKIPSYNITNFNKDWNDGRAICALANAVAGDPPIIPDLKSMSSMNGAKNCNRGITEAYEWLGIPQLLSPENMANPALDDLSMMTYISYFKGAKRRSTRMSDGHGDGTTASSSAAPAIAISQPAPAPAQEPEPEPQTNESESHSQSQPEAQGGDQSGNDSESQSATQSGSDGKTADDSSNQDDGNAQSKLNPWERDDDWREYEGHNLGGRNKIRVYFSTTTSSSVIRKRSEELMGLMERLKLQERPDFEPWIPIDIDMSKEQRDKIFEKAGTRETPMLFVDDEFVGTYEKLMEMNESGELQRVFEY